MNAWETILVAFGGNAILLTVLAFLSKSLLEKLFARDTKRFETDLQAKADVAIEHLRSQFQIQGIEHQVRFSRLHEKRAEVIAELYGLLVLALWEAESFVSPIEWVGEPNKQEKHQTAMNKLVELYRYFDQHRIYLPEQLCESLDQLIKEVRSNVINFGVWVKYRDETLQEHAAKNKQAAWDASWKAIKDEIPLARSRLENEFRILLGSLPSIQTNEQPKSISNSSG